jgi:hypothetical protein
MRQPGGQLDRPAVGLQHVDDSRVVVEHRGDLAVLAQCAQHVALEVAGGAGVVVPAHDEWPAGQVVAGEPALGEPTGALRTPGQVHDVVVDQGGAQLLGALDEQRVTVGGLEEPLPALRPGLEVVQAVPDVGQHAVDVEHSERAAGRERDGELGADVESVGEWLRHVSKPK